MDTTIQISKNLLGELKKRKINVKERYENIMWDLLEDTMELSEQTKRDIQEAREQIARGESYTLEQVKKELKL